MAAQRLGWSPSDRDSELGSHHRGWHVARPSHGDGAGSSRTAARRALTVTVTVTVTHLSEDGRRPGRIHGGAAAAGRAEARAPDR